jgi:hypothetical protein
MAVDGWRTTFFLLVAAPLLKAACDSFIHSAKLNQHLGVKLKQSPFQAFFLY